MKNPLRNKNAKAFTLIEIAIVIGIITLLAIGVTQAANSFRTQANTSLCIVNQKQVQDAMRSYAAINNVPIGGACSHDDIINSTTGMIPSEPACPTMGTSAYSYSNTVPPIGTAWVTCSTTNHTPSATMLISW